MPCPYGWAVHHSVGATHASPPTQVSPPWRRGWVPPPRPSGVIDGGKASVVVKSWHLAALAEMNFGQRLDEEQQ